MPALVGVLPSQFSRDFLGHGNFSAEIETILGKLGWPPYTEHMLSPLEMEKTNKRTSKLYHCFYSGKNEDLKVWVRGDVRDIVARSFPGKVKQEH